MHPRAKTPLLIFYAFIGYISAFQWLITVFSLMLLKFALFISYIAFLDTFWILAVFMVNPI
jgi:hypothetical protein